MAGELTAEEWRSLIDVWVGSGHHIKHLEVPPAVAKQLGIEIEEETKMDDTTDTTDTTEQQQTPTGGHWKRKKYFDGAQCGMKDCTRKPDGYICDTKPTKGNTNGRLWYGPACAKCVKSYNEALKPMSLAALAYQRNGASDLALVLDIEVGEVKRRLAAAGIDDKGQPFDYASEATTMHHTTAQQLELPSPSQPETPQMGIQVSLAAAITIPSTQLQAQLQEAQGFAAYLSTFHISNQQMMNQAAAWLNGWEHEGVRYLGIKAKWSMLDEMRKDIVRPWQEKVKEVQAFFKPALDALAETEKLLKQRITEGQALANQAQQQALLEAQAAHQQGNIQQVATLAQQASQADVVLPAGIHARTVIRFEVQDPSQLPGPLWSPDPAKIQAAIDAGYRQIPGVRIWEEQVVSGRR